MPVFLKERRLFAFTLCPKLIFSPFIPAGRNSSWPMVVQCPTPAIANQFLELVRPLVNTLYSHEPRRLLDELARYSQWGEACDLLEQATDVFLVLVRAHRIGIYCGRYVYNSTFNIVSYSI